MKKIISPPSKLPGDAARNKIAKGINIPSIKSDTPKIIKVPVADPCEPVTSIKKFIMAESSIANSMLRQNARIKTRIMLYAETPPSPIEFHTKMPIVPVK